MIFYCIGPLWRKSTSDTGIHPQSISYVAIWCYFVAKLETIETNCWFAIDLICLNIHMTSLLLN